MNKKRGRFFIALGTLLLLAALSLVLLNVSEDNEAGRSADEALAKLIEQIPDDYSESEEEIIPSELTGEQQDDSQQEPEQEQEAIELDGQYYIGVLTIPAIDLELPVQKGWNYHNLAISPCRYYGEPAEGNMIIAAHNYSAFFKRINELSSGDEIYFTSLSGKTRKYEVAWTELISGKDAASIIAGEDSWDLTLFTCTWSGYSRVTVRAIEITDE